jgi:glycosyltransferase involved in cell wall biosynthesis
MVKGVEPKVSIIIPVYNGADYLDEAIGSALDQEYPHIEVIVINDGSDDGGKTGEIARSYGDRIRYFSKDNGGVASALNMGIENMTGEYFSWLSHDDVYFSNKISEQIAYLEHIKRENTVLYSDFELIDEDSRSLGTVVLKDMEPQEIPKALLYSSFIHGCTLLIPKACFLSEGHFNESLKSTQDYDMWFRLFKKYEFVHLGKVLVKSRQHSNQGSRSLGKAHRDELNKFYVWAMKRLNENEKVYFKTESKRRFFARLSYDLFRRRFFPAAFCCAFLILKSMMPRETHGLNPTP